MANEIKTVDDLRGAYPALVNEIEEAAANKATSDDASASTTSRTWPCPAARR